ncbi:DUF4179 domain-containing protein [Paenibacillus contaminans]|uniref:DUF4179 domain-containing protein n=2 Tax=Paenibacillus contaminans TaxID=450362 RepID=A0A329MWC0_9BACL|nr:DUF4179 domain-containing protein [Paenibacillus contaminans]
MLELEEAEHTDKKATTVHDCKLAVACLEQSNGGFTTVTDCKDRSGKGRNRLFKLKGTSFWKLTIATASLLILLSTAVIYAVPTLAETLRSLFARDETDIGLLRAQEFGMVEHPHIQVKDKGYTVKIDEAVADPTRVVVALQLFGPDGKHDRDRLVINDENSIIIKDDQGKVVGELYDMGMTSDFYYLVAFFPDPLQSDSITIEGRLTQLGNKLQNTSVVKGEWDFNFSIDMKEAKKKTIVTPLEGSYTAPDGMTVRLKRLTRMVQGVRLELDTELSEEALGRSPGELWKEQSLKFHFENLQGEEIHSVNTRKTPHKDSLMTQSHLPGDKPGLMHWSYTFKDLPQDNPYSFVWDGYSISEWDGASVQFEPAKLKVQPIPFRFDGDELMLRDFTIEFPPNTNGKEVEGALHLDGKLRNEDRHNEWILEIPGGKTYTTTMRGAMTSEASGWKDGYSLLGGPQLGGLFNFRAQGLSTIPDQLRLIRTVVDRLYTNIDWSIPVEEES